PVAAPAAVQLPAQAVVGALRLEDAVVAEVHQGVEVLVGADPHAATAATVATVRATERDELLATEADTAIAAVAGEHFDFCFVYQFHFLRCLRWARRACRRHSVGAGAGRAE